MKLQSSADVDRSRRRLRRRSVFPPIWRATVEIGQVVPRAKPIAPRISARGCSSTFSPSAGALTPVSVSLRSPGPRKVRSYCRPAIRPWIEKRPSLGFAACRSRRRPSGGNGADADLAFDVLRQPQPAPDRGAGGEPDVDVARVARAREHVGHDTDQRARGRDQRVTARRQVDVEAAVVADPRGHPARLIFGHDIDLVRRFRRRRETARDRAGARCRPIRDESARRKSRVAPRFRADRWRRFRRSVGGGRLGDRRRPLTVTTTRATSMTASAAHNRIADCRQPIRARVPPRGPLPAPEELSFPAFFERHADLFFVGPLRVGRGRRGRRPARPGRRGARTRRRRPPRSRGSPARPPPPARTRRGPSGCRRSRPSRRLR